MIAPGELEPHGTKPLKHARVYINAHQYFEGVAPEVRWFCIGGYKVCERWLRHRQGQALHEYRDLTHYQKIATVVAEVLQVMARIDAAVPQWPVHSANRGAPS